MSRFTVIIAFPFAPMVFVPAGASVVEMARSIIFQAASVTSEEVEIFAV